MTQNTPTTQPHNLEAEKTVCGALLLDPEAIHRVRGKLSPEQFYDPIYRAVYEACTKLYDEHKPIDFVTVANVLEDHKKIGAIGGSAFLADLAASVPTSSHVDQYAAVVHQKASHRDLITIGQQIAGLGYEEDQSIDELVGKAQEAVLTLGQQGIDDTAETLGAVTERRYSVFCEAKEGGDAEIKRRVRTGFTNIDWYYNGFEPKTLTTVAGRPAMGKTAFLLNLAYNAAQMHGKRCYIFSLEMSKEQLSDRLSSGRLGLSMWKLQKGDTTDEEMHAFGDVVGEFQDLPITIDDDSNASIDNIRAKSMRHQMEHGLDVLFIDYLQLIGPPSSLRRNANRTEEVGTISRELKQLSRKLDIPVIVACQLSRATESRVKCIPQLADLRESGSIEQDSDNVLMLWREGHYDPDCDHPDITTVFARKNRQGPVGEAELTFRKKSTTFVPVDRNHGEPESSAL